MPPLLDAAVDALGFVRGPGLVTLKDGVFTVVAVREGRGGRAEGADAERVARAAWLRAGQARAWPVPELPPATEGIVDRGGPIREAVATTWGTRVYESREPIQSVRSGSSGWVRLEDGRVLEAGELLRALAPVYGVELQLGEPPPTTHEGVTLIDDHADTHSFDANGVRRPRTLIVDCGRFVQGVGEGHATRELTLSAMASHLRFVGDDDMGPGEKTGPLRSSEARELLSQVVACSAG